MEGKISNIIFTTITMLTTMVPLSSCIFDYEGDCSGEDGIEGWHRAIVEATYNTEWEIPVTPRFDWKHEWPDSMGISYNALRPVVPDGLRMMCYGKDVIPHPVNLQATGGDADMPGGRLDLLFYNNDTEYIVFENLKDFYNVTASTRHRNRITYSGNRALGTDASSEPTVSAPDMLFTNSISGYEATDGGNNRIEITMEPVVFTYAIHFSFDKGLEHVTLARGTLSGMARGVNLHTFTTLADKATILYDCVVHSDGITAAVQSFGIPDYSIHDEHPGLEGRYGITLEMMLDNGKTITRDFDVTPQVSVQPLGGVVIVGHININEDESMPPSGGGAFDVDVNDWGDNEDIYIDF